MVENIRKLGLVFVFTVKMKDKTHNKMNMERMKEDLPIKMNGFLF